jgi:hypothetical protein
MVVMVVMVVRLGNKGLRLFSRGGDFPETPRENSTVILVNYQSSAASILGRWLLDLTITCFDTLTPRYHAA